MILRYMVPARARRRLLETLLSQDRELSVRQLAALAGVPYSNAHKEVAEMRKAGLVRTRRMGPCLACLWNKRHPATRALRLLLRHDRAAGPPSLPDEKALLWNLRRFGAPLAEKGARAGKWPAEKVLARALELARRRADVARVWPVVYARNRRGVNHAELESRAHDLGQKRTLGFFLSLCSLLLDDPGLGRRAERLRDRRVTRTEDFFPGPAGERTRKLMERNTPKVAREWNFRMNMPMDSFRSIFNKFRSDGP